jgi:hypothetical protein
MGFQDIGDMLKSVGIAKEQERLEKETLRLSVVIVRMVLLIVMI